MRKLIWIVFWLFSFTFSFASTDKEVVIIKVEYSKKKDGFHSKLVLEMGVSNTHSLYHTFQNDENGTVTYKDTDGKLKVFSNEIDLMNFLFTLGYSYKEVYPSKILNEEFYNFVLIKE